MTAAGPSWGIVSTVRGSARDILSFAAYHLDLGADHLYLYLDEPNRRAFRPLRRHPKVTVRICDDTFWAARKRDKPERHQVRQTVHATFTYRHTDLDWLAHIDVDEFLWPTAPIADLLGEVPETVHAVRVRPIEALACGDDLYKAFIPQGPEREALVETIYPNYGAFVLGGFLSHVQGKLFVRTGMENLNYRIHNLFQNKVILPCKTEMPQIDLCHRHAPDWEHWWSHYRFRLERGSYQPGMAPNVHRDRGGLNMNELLSWIEAEEGEKGLRKFFDELSATDPQVRARLQERGLIKHRPLDLEEQLQKHFPGSF
ncbi:glycosyltransferase family 2 protein [Ruegeria arenilitoris]|uniref:glycosyltransferase family 2 protein n=1 Tax=Ruegeria arenilitoris TaxID=1173585 RepID=UPI00147995CF|nr:glycosyltransferase family 2 protein [Ruegeria arenilitoris]